MKTKTILNIMSKNLYDKKYIDLTTTELKDLAHKMGINA